MYKYVCTPNNVPDDENGRLTTVVEAFKMHGKCMIYSFIFSSILNIIHSFKKYIEHEE